MHLTVHFHLTVRFPAGKTGKGTGEGQSEARLTAAEDGAACGALSSVSDLAATVEALREAGAHFRNEIITGIGGKQILVEDPSGNPIELFEPTLPEARLSTSS
jgi:catechol 2,3-dioxygenase-like lactoylglutathione lyase family enzyme